MADIHIPGLGNVDRRWVIAVGGITAVIVGVAWWRHSQTAAAVSTPAASDAAAADTFEPPLVATGGGFVGQPFGPIVEQGSSSVETVTPIGPETNADWATMAESELLAAGIDTTVSAAAIGKILGGLPVTPAQQQTFLQAVGLLGNPPQGYPTPIKVTSAGTGPGDGDRSTHTIPTTPGAVRGLHLVDVSRTSAQFDWEPPAGGGSRGYDIFLDGKMLSSRAHTAATIHFLKRNHAYVLGVRPVGSNGTHGPMSTVQFRTER